MTEGLVGAQIEIYWDGDLVYYPCKVSRYDAATNKFWVLYENDESGAEYEEDLANSKWRIWAGTEEEFNANKIIKVSLVLQRLVVVWRIWCVVSIFAMFVQEESMLRSDFVEFVAFSLSLPC